MIWTRSGDHLPPVEAEAKQRLHKWSVSGGSTSQIQLTAHAMRSIQMSSIVYIDTMLTLLLAGGVWVLPSLPVSFFSGPIAKRLEIGGWNFLNFKGHSLRIFCEFFGAGQVWSPGQVSWPSFKKSRPRNGYSSRRLSMKLLLGFLEAIVTYKKYYSEFFILVT